MCNQYETHSNYYKGYGILFNNNKSVFMNDCILTLIVHNLMKKI